MAAARKERGGRVDFDAAAIFWCVMLGHLEGKPLTASVIAELTGLARTTVMRKLARLVAAGEMIRKADATYCLSARMVDDPLVQRVSRHLARTFKVAAADLSKMDG